MLTVKNNYLTRNRCFINGTKRKAIGIQIHSIGTGQNTAQSVADYWNQSAVSACVTYICDAEQPGLVLRCLPEDYYTWADAGWGNKNLITIEMCESDWIKYTGNGAEYRVTNEAKFKADVLRSYQTAVELCADICKRYGWNPEAKLSNGMYLISSHDEGRRAGLSSAHVDPSHIWPRFGLSMEKFRKDVKACMGGQEFSTEVKWYRVRLSWADEKSQVGAYEVLDNAKANCPAGYTVYDSNGKAVYTREARGTQARSLNGLSEAEKIARVAPLYQKVAKETGMLASVGLAQFALESGYGTTDLAQNANNLHGMKCSLSGNTWSGSTWDGVSKYNKRTAEQDKNGNEYFIYADFRKYECIEDSIADRAQYYLGAMNGSARRYPGIENLTTAESQIRAIKEGHYATDVNYVSKLLNIVRRFDLTQYDVPKEQTKPAKPETPKEQEAGKEEKQVKDVYAVRRAFGETDGQLGLFHILDNAKKLADKNYGYKVFDVETKKCVYEPNITKRQAFIGALTEMDRVMRKDIAEGKDWKYSNGSLPQGRTFDISRSKGYYATNCVLGVQWGLHIIGIDAYGWYGAKNSRISWGSQGAEAEIRKWFNIIDVNGTKTVSGLVKDGTLQAGDVLTYVSMNHTNAYLGNKTSFDSGHAHCTRGGEGAPFTKWIGPLTCGDQPVGKILRWKTDKHVFRVQVGAFETEKALNALKKKIKDETGFDCFSESDAGMTYLFCGSFEQKAKAEERIAAVRKVVPKAFIKETDVLV